MENITAMSSKQDEKLALWVARELKHLRLTFMDAHKMTSVDQFAKHVGVTKRHIYSLEDHKHSPRVDTLAQVLKACDTDLATFFAKLVTHMQLAQLQQQSAEEQRVIALLVAGLSNPRTLKIVRNASENVQELLGLLDVR